jgi:hypothetical protein
VKPVKTGFTFFFQKASRFMSVRSSCLAVFLACAMCAAPVHAQNATPSPGASPEMQADLIASEAIDRVWSGHSVRFALLVTGTQFVIGYYDAERQLTVAARPIAGGAWTYRKLDTWNGWDSHNYIAMAEDGAGRIHIAANMHASPLTAFVSDAGGDVRSLHRVAQLADPALERSMTYPVYLRDKDGRLIFKYRDGRSGDGNEIYDALDVRTGAWSRLTPVPLTDGQGLRNAYFMGPVLGPDGWFHIAWVWRESPMAETNHDLSYAKSPDLVHWFHADGTPFKLPIRLDDAEIVDPVPVRGGMINNNTIIGFDDKGRAMITYHKYDKDGNTQIYVARYEGENAGGNGWRIAQVSRWKHYRWDFSGGGSLNAELFVSGVEPAGAGLLKVPVIRKGQSIDFLIRSSDLGLVSETPVQSLADQLKARFATPDGMQLNVVDAEGKDGKVYALVWAARPPHRDEPSSDIPDPTTLSFVTLKRK